jgi:arylesterase / paraoxonase
MKKALRYSLIVALLLVAFILKTLHSAGAFFYPKDLVIGSLKTLPGPDGCEDITIDHTAEIAYVSSQNRREFSQPGGIYFIKLKDSAWAFKKMTIVGTEQPLSPHGISLYKKYLFVVNHSGGHSIEKFLIQNDSLVYLKSYKNNALKSPNDVLAVAENKFYFTNDHATPMGLRRTLEDFLQIPTGYTTYYDGYTYAPATPKECYLNGINMRGDTLYTASTIGHKLCMYKRDTTTGRLKPLASKKFAAGLDNIEINTDGRLLVGAHTQLLAFTSHAKDPTKVSPAEILSLDPHTLEPKLLYSTVGKPMSGISVAAGHRNHLLIGAVFDSGILVNKRK